MLRYIFLVGLLVAPLQAFAACISIGIGTASCDGNLVTDTGGYSPDGQIIINSPNSMPPPMMHNDDSSSHNQLMTDNNSPPEKCTNNCYPFESLFEGEKSSYTPKKTPDSNPHYADHNDPWNH